MPRTIFQVVVLKDTWSTGPTRNVAGHHIEDARDILVSEVALTTESMPPLMQSVARHRAMHAEVGQRIRIGDYEHWIEEVKLP